MIFRIVLISVLCHFAVNAQAAAPDLIIVNANVRTMSASRPRAEAVAIGNGRITAVGSTSEIRKLAGPETRVIDAEGRLVLPGFNDSHIHLAAVGNLFSSADMSTARTAGEVLAKLRHFSRFLPKGRWILGSGIDPSIVPAPEEIDAATPDVPLLIYCTDPDKAMTNRNALRSASAQNSSYIVSGNILEVIRQKIPKDHIKDLPAIIETASNYAASFGITSVQDTHSDDLYEILKDLERSGRLKTRVYDCVPLTDRRRLAETKERQSGLARRGCVKGFWDEFDTGSRVLAADVFGADEAGLQIAVHAMGAEANKAVLDIYARLVSNRGRRDRRLRIEHAYRLAEADTVRFRKFDVIASMQPILFFVSDKVGSRDDYRRMLAAGVRLAFGSDAPMDGIDPVEGIYDAVNAGGGRGITVEQAVRAYTMGSAFAEFQEREKGSIEAGKFADIVILSSDIFAEGANIRSARAVLTMVNGKIVYAQ